MSKLKYIVEHPWINLLSGLILLISASIEIVQTIEENDLGAHHGVAIFAVIHILQNLPHILHGLEQTSKMNKH